MKKRSVVLTQYAPILLGVLVLSGLYLIQSHNYLLFHGLAKAFNCRQHVRVGLDWTIDPGVQTR